MQGWGCYPTYSTEVEGSVILSCIFFFRRSWKLQSPPPPYPALYPTPRSMLFNNIWPTWSFEYLHVSSSYLWYHYSYSEDFTFWGQISNKTIHDYEVVSVCLKRLVKLWYLDEAKSFRSKGKQIHRCVKEFTCKHDQTHRCIIQYTCKCYWQQGPTWSRW